MPEKPIETLDTDTDVQASRAAPADADAQPTTGASAEPATDARGSDRRTFWPTAAIAQRKIWNI